MYPLSMRQAELHPSPSVTLASSHDSAINLYPSPQTLGTAAQTLAGHL